MKQNTTSNHFVLDNLIERMWEIRKRHLANPQDRSLEQQWIFIKRVAARALVRRAQSK
jgi:hypothetical protein